MKAGQKDEADRERDKKYQQILKETKDLEKKQAEEAGPRRLQQQIRQQTGQRIPLEQATEIFKQREAEQRKAENDRIRSRLESSRFQSMMGTQSTHTDEIAYLMEQDRQAKALYAKNKQLHQKVRTAMSNGLPQ
jgi:hypothetical protein